MYLKSQFKAINKPFQVRVENGEVRVVLVEDVGGGALDGEVPDRVAAGLAVGRPDHFHVVPGIQGDTSERSKPPVDLVPTVPAAGGPLL